MKKLADLSNGDLMNLQLEDSYNNLHQDNERNAKFFENLITVNEISEWLRVPKKTIRDWVYKRKIPFKKVGNHIRFARSEIKLWINKGA